ncbi:MAG TPA: thiolase family protein [Candidatus Binatia bacterium]|nr:thiolase family protein [Candidatus Binatia bacterium]
MEAVYIVGVGMTPFGKLLERSVKDLTKEAVTAALGDAGCATADLEAAYFSNACQGHMEGQDLIRGEIALRSMGIEGIPVTNVENACASASTALYGAVQFLRAGMGEIALAVGVDKMVSTDRARMFSAFDSGWDVATAEENRRRLLALGAGVAVPEGTTSPRPYSAMMDVYAAWARFHMRRFGTTREQLAAVAAKNHAHSMHNRLSQYRATYTVDEVLAAPPITYPLTLPMCAPISDGAAAAVVVRESALARFDRARAVKIFASVLRSGTDRKPEEVEKHIGRRAALAAYSQAGIEPRDISVAEVHDATAMGEITQIENLGFCEFGEGGPTSARGETRLGGRIPVNPSGGLESKGHPIGATGLGQIFELVTQLRGEAGRRQVRSARFAIAENGGGVHGIEEAACCVTILGRRAA